MGSPSYAQNTDLLNSLQESEGLTFSVPGPNCFASALKLTGMTPSFRGMDEPEFSAIVKASCPVTASPQPGDIGVYETPGFGFIHAYVYVSDQLGMQKPGVDYAGKTAISFQSLDAIRFTYLASPECRRYARDLSECSNKHYYLRCSPSQENKGSVEYRQMVHKIEAAFESVLNAPDLNFDHGAVVEELKMQVMQLEEYLKRESNLSSAQKAIAVARQKSFEKQIQFIESAK